MRTVTVEELREKTPELLELVQAGETLDVKDGERLVATFGPPRDDEADGTLEERIADRLRRGLMSAGPSAGAPVGSTKAPLPSKASALQLFLEEERNNGR